MNKGLGAPLLSSRRTGGAHDTQHIHLRIYRYRITDNPSAWLTVIAPGCDLDQVTRDLRARYHDRLLAVQPHESNTTNGGDLNE